MADDDGSGHQETSVPYDIIACMIFAFMSSCLFFPNNDYIPLDRRTASVIAGTLCYVTRNFFFPNNKLNVEEAVDFDVLLLLAAIMCINYIVVNQKETLAVVEYVQNQIRDKPKNGFWLVAFSAFLASPFLTNDGVCLLFVEPILNAFSEIINESEEETKKKEEEDVDFNANNDFKLDKKDALYFLLGLACSSNIGSALTYTGNPQNMIVSQDAVGVMPPYLFLAYMLLPSLSGWLITLLWIQRCWMRMRGDLSNERRERSSHFKQISGNPMIDSQSGHSVSTEMDEKTIEMATVDTERALMLQEAINDRRKRYKKKPLDLVIFNKKSTDGEEFGMSSMEPKKQTMLKKVAKIIVSPFPYAMMMIMAIMIALIFIDIMSIAGLVCMTAVVMTVILVLGNHWQGLPIFGGHEDAPPLTAEEKKMNTSLFFDELFDSIDYSLLLIFLGTFIVVENMDSTGLPKKLWNSIVGDTPFDTFASVFGISVFIIVSSQFLGNVAVIQLAKPNVAELEDDEKRYAWAIISFVATVGGNLTITGSAANIIVAEKASRIDPNSSVDFFKHAKVCFFVTLFSVVMGALMITAVVMVDNNLRESW